MRSLTIGALVLMLVPVDGVGQSGPPEMIVGQFEDDYGGRHAVSPALWTHGRARYHVVAWYPGEQYVIARNDSANPGDGGLYTRIDWMPLAMPPYTWAFCLSAYNAPTADSAAATRLARRDTPRTGCNGHPFSRMKPSTAPAAPGDSSYGSRRP